MQAMHSSPLSGHLGQGSCIQRLKSFFYWLTLKQDVVNLIQGCEVCQKANPEHIPYQGLLQPLPIPQHYGVLFLWIFVEKLPESEGHNPIMVIMDRLTKFAHFIPITHPISALRIAKLFVDHIYKLHGLPEAIVSDKIFTSSLWQQLFKLLGATFIILKAMVKLKESINVSRPI